MMLGKPVIVTRCGGPESFVTPQTGIIIEKENPKELVSAMMQMASAADKYNGKEIHQFALKNFGAAAFEKAVLEYYNEAINGNTSTSNKATQQPTKISVA
jgi:glycosyltransferase involved in cell wall biosynthesis